MARRKQAAADLSEFTEGDADQEQLARLASAREAELKKEGPGHNSGEPPPEVLKRNADAIELGLLEINNAQKLVQKARAEFKAIRDTAKNDFGGSRAWVESTVKAVKLKLQSAKGGTGEIVSEHRQIGTVLRLLDDCPLGHQYGLFAEPTPEAEQSAEQQESEAELAGAHAWANNEQVGNNPHPDPASPKHVGWARGWHRAQIAGVREMDESTTH